MHNDNDLVHARRDCAPAADLAETASYALEKATNQVEGSFLELLTAVLMSALTFEAVLNSAGVHVWGADTAIWAVVERARPLDKFAAIAEHAHFVCDKGSRPYQTVAALMTLRSDIVHAKPEHFEADITRGAAKANRGFHAMPGLSPKWEQACTDDFAARAIEDVDALSEQLSAHIGMDNPILFGGGSGYFG